jgi:hypothetical protein
MSTTVVPALRPQSGRPATSRSRPGSATARPLPLPPVPTRATSATVYGVAVMDCHGRLAERAVLRALDWSPGQPVALHVVDGSIQVMHDPTGTVAIGRDGNLRLPIGLRRRCGLATGDRLLLVATPPSGLMHLHPPATIDALFAAHHARASVDAS